MFQGADICYQHKEEVSELQTFHLFRHILMLHLQAVLQSRPAALHLHRFVQQNPLQQHVYRKYKVNCKYRLNNGHKCDMDLAFNMGR